MANGFARLEFVTRSKGQNALTKAEYTSRTGPRFENQALDQENPSLDTSSPDKSFYTSRSGSWSHKDDCLHHEILLPERASKQFLDMKYLWTAVEEKEKRVNSQVCLEFVIALPDDSVISHADRVELSRRFSSHFVDQGFIVQLNLHAPKLELTVQQPNRALGLTAGMKGDVLEQSKHQITVEFEGRKKVTFDPQDYTGYSIASVNHHAHGLVTTRRLKESGEAFEDHKPRNLIKKLANTEWGKVWTTLQNTYFKEKKIDLEVDPYGVIGQNHLGPKRMRSPQSELLLKENATIQELNATACQNPELLLAALTQEHPFFERKDVEHFITQHAAKEHLKTIREMFWSYAKIVPLYDKITGEKTSYYTSSDLVKNDKDLQHMAFPLMMEPSKAEEGNAIFYRMSPRAEVILKEPLKEKASDPLILAKAEKLLEAVTDQHSVFSRKDVDRLIHQHIPPSESKAVLNRFWDQPHLVKLYRKDPSTGYHLETGLYSSLSASQEEQDILTLSHHLDQKNNFNLNAPHLLDDNDLKRLSPEQQQAYHQITHRSTHLTLIQGDAGTGKSYLLKALQQTYQRAGYHVRALGPDHATCKALKEKNLTDTQTVHALLFHTYNKSDYIAAGKEVWIVDEAGKLSNQLLRELLCRSDEYGIPLILAGDQKQLPPLQRGGLFAFLCQNYPSHALKEIQRQHNPLHRQAASSLAQGKAAVALDQLHASGAIHWRDDVKGCMEGLINRWALYTQAGDLEATLLLATSNRERRVLNEMARDVRKHRGELTGQELACITAYGKIYVAAGDRIVLRKNNKDLGITSGMCGTLVEASSERFVVRVTQEDKSVQVVSFHPEKFPFYDLGYASTTYSSQGRTVKNCLVLHGAYPSLQKLYVQATRHQMEVHLFVPSDRVKNFLQLKAGYSQSSLKETTLSYVTSIDLRKKVGYREQQKEIDQLKERKLSLSYLKGVYKQAQLNRKERRDQRETEKRARMPSDAFYRYKEEEATTGRAQPIQFGEPVFEMRREICGVSLSSAGAPSGNLEKNEGVQTYWIQDLQQAFEAGPVKGSRFMTLEQDQIKSVETTLQGRKACHTGQKSLKAPRSLDPRSSDLRFSKESSPPSEPLSPESQKRVQSYNEGWKAAHVLYLLVEEEAKRMNIDREKTPSFSGWKEARYQRDRLAYEASQTLTPAEKKAFFSEKGIEVLQEQARAHERRLERQSGRSTLSLDERLKADLPFVLSRLFPDQRPKKAGNYLRYGSKGSLSVCVSDSKLGQWSDFEHQQSGGILKLIQVRMGLGKEEARAWAENLLGNPAKEPSMSPVYYVKASQEKEDEWVSLKPSKDHPAPPLKSCGKTGYGLSLSYNEIARHAYHDEKGDVLYYVMRLQLKDREGDKAPKITPPLSYGYWKSAPHELKWEIKGYKEEMRTLYNVHLLNQNPQLAVVIVEGEKAADQAPEKFAKKDYIFVTSSGGAGAACRSDWTPLIGREVILWPDNDKAGLQYGDDVCKELRRVGVRSLTMVDHKKLQEVFPEKWDLADPLPKGVDKDDIQRLLTSGIEKALDVETAMDKMNLDPTDAILRHRVHEILWRVDERLRPGLEAQKLDEYRLREAILRETQRIYEENTKAFANKGLESNLFSEAHRSETHLSGVSYQACITEALTGRRARGSELEMIKKAFHQEGGRDLSKEIDPIAAQIWKDTHLSCHLEKSLGIREEKKIEVSLKEEEAIQKNLRNLEQQRQQAMIAERAKEHQRSLSRGIEL